MTYSRFYRSLNRVETLRKSCENCLLPMAGERFVAPYYNEAASRLARTFPQGHVPTIESTLRPWLGSQLTEASVKAIALRIAGTELLLRKKQPSPSWFPRPEAEEVPALIEQVTQTEPRPGKARKPAFVVRARILAGTAVDRSVELLWSPDLAYFLRRSPIELAGYEKSKGFCFPRTRPDDSEQPLHAFDTPLDYAGLYCLFVIPASAMELRLEGLHFDAETAKRNQGIQALRERTNPDAPCPNRVSPTIPCRSCPAGRDRCPAALHLLTWVRKECPGCRRATWFETPHANFCRACTRNRETTNV